MNLSAMLRVSTLAMFFAVCAFAQRDLATLVGTVSDPSGAGIPSAKVSISEEATGLKYDLVTTAGGEFARPALKPGVYTVTVEAAGRRVSTTLRQSAKEFSEYSFLDLENPMRRVC